MFTIKDFPEALCEKKNAPLLTGILRGVEREGLRADSSAALALTSHPLALGSALTHPQITTDFSEALLEFITPPTHNVEDLFAHLSSIHQFTQKQLTNEVLWTHSMPCRLGEDGAIPVAKYGSSNNGRMKTTYRVGLGNRYGRTMQTVAGVHYNFSLPNAFWAFLSRERNSIDDLQAFKDKGYFSLIRNFRRHYWLLIYLFGASPVLDKSFVKNKKHNLLPLDDETLYSPYATSLRMGDLGYQSSAQESLHVCYNQKSTYIKTLCKAITTPHDAYAELGLKDPIGAYKQLNTGLLQIENEFYSSIRPKRTTQHGETALAALKERGVEYIEVRCLDINPHTPVGLSPEQVYFLDTFLVYCALKDSPNCTKEETIAIIKNQKAVVNNGRKPLIELDDLNGGTISLQKWAEELVYAMAPVAEMLDNANGVKHHSESLATQHEKIKNSDLTPSGNLLAELKRENQSFVDYIQAKSHEHAATLKNLPLSDATIKRMEDMAVESIAEQKVLENNSTLDFDTFLKEYYQQYTTCSGCK